MRFKQNYTLFKRGKIWYYRCYSPEGIRTSGTSTGLSSKVKAQQFCEQLFQDGLLYENKSAKILGPYIEHFYDLNSPYMVDLMATGTEEHPALADSTIRKLQSMLATHILPYFEKVRIKDFTPSQIKAFRQELLNKELSHKSINNIVSALTTISKSLINDGVIELDPMAGIKPMKGDSEKVDAFTVPEAKKILLSQWDNNKAKIINLISCCTGLRLSECLAIRPETVFPDYIDVRDQQNETATKLVPIKTKNMRKVPICSELYEIIQDALEMDPKFFFVTKNIPYKRLILKLQELDFQEAREERNLRFHSWRHLYNTWLLSENVAPVKVAAVIGHTFKGCNVQMTYTNFKPEDYKEIYEAQKKLFNKIFQ